VIDEEIDGPQDQSTDQDDDTWKQEVRGRRQRLFAEETELPDPPRSRAPNDETRQPEDIRAQIDAEVADIHLASMARRQAEAASVPPPAPPNIESDFSAFPSVPFRKPEGEKTPFALQKSVTCPSASVVCDSVSASKSKCGFAGFQSDETITYYLQCIRHLFIPSDLTQDCAGCPVDLTITTTVNSSTCDSTVACSGTAKTCDPVSITSPQGSIPCDPCDLSCGSVCMDGWFVNCPSLDCGEIDIDSPYTQSDTYAKCVSGSIYEEWTLSEEYTLAILKSNTISALPVYSGSYGETCLGATYNLSSDGSSFTLRREKCKIQFSAAACAGMVVTWKEHFVASPSGTVTDVNKSWTASGGETEIGVYTIPDPTSNGTTTITNITVDCSGCPKKTMFGEVDA
jgi:hypothetical protein